MNVLEFIVLVILAGMLGVVAQRILGTKYGLLVTVVLGFVGALIGLQLGKWFHLGVRLYLVVGNEQVHLFWATVGALIVTFVAGIISKSNRKAQKQ
ncbi:MAG TPA: hypothetical protein VEJ18_20975 [Planctomycetota bacterium]|nr:hypothetical protein [Planctomycetota bacterium]